MLNVQPLLDECRRPGDLEVRDLKETVRKLEQLLFKANQDNCDLIARIDQLRSHNRMLMEEVERLSLDLGLRGHSQD